MSRMLPWVTRGDITVLAFLVLAALLAVPMSVMAGGDTDGTATITGPHGDTIVPLDQEETYVIEGREGDVVFVVGGGELSCVESSCEEQVCVRLHTVTRSRPVICAPNGVSAVLTYAPDSGAEEDLDAVSR